MAVKLIMQFSGFSLVATDTEGREALNSLAKGELVSVSIVRPRNINHHRLFFKMIGEVWKAVPEYRKIQNGWLVQEDMLDDIKIALGHARNRVRPDGTVSFVPRSISFSRLDQTGFDEFYNRFLDYCVRVIIPGVNKSDFEMHLYSIMDGRDYEGLKR